MKKGKLIELLQEEFPKESAYIEDYIGLQIDGKDEVKNILITLNLTIDVISQALENNVDFIISHHPLIFGEEEIIEKDLFLKSKFEVLKKENINVFIIHTNADFNPNSIAYNLGTILDLNKIEHLNENLGITGQLKNPISLEILSKELKKVLYLKNEFRTNIDLTTNIKNIVIGSGAAGDLIYNPYLKDNLFIIGELKYHHWVYANEQSIKVLEIGHFSEILFKDIVEVYLNENTSTLKIYKSKEENEYYSF